MAATYADIILPLAVRGKFTYMIPDNLLHSVRPGVKVLVQFGKKNLYTGIVSRIHHNTPEISNIRQIVSVNEVSTVNEKQIRFWEWLADYYMCSEGEVLKAAVPSALLPDGRTDTPVVAKYRPKEETFITIAGDTSETDLHRMLDNLKKAPKQAQLLTGFIEISEYSEGKPAGPVQKSLLLKKTGCGAAALEALIDKKILSPVMIEVGRLDSGPVGKESLNSLNKLQQSVCESINKQFVNKEIVLLHGITSSGKTEIYFHLIEEQLRQDKQVLYLLPEIALTTQVIHRLKKYFGSRAGIYHSRFNDQEKAEIWNRVAGSDPESGYRIIIGARSSLFLPFNNLGLIIVDEEHDSSYKQHDPAPRYNARDSAIMLAGIHKAKTLLGSASPSVESYYNALNGKYGFAELKERYGSIRLPSIILANTREAYRKKLMVSHFTPELLQAMDEALGNEEQIILFQNRRGFSPYIECTECGWIPVCINCAVNLTYHKEASKLVCHYCGYSTGLNAKCGSCGSSGLSTRGFGTEKVEDEIKIVFPSARVARMDHDTTKGKYSFGRIIRAFEERRIDILIGTQMISKGLDFENLTVVGILNADNMLNFPDFRSHERSFQLMEQVSGRAGRRQKQGKVVIQTADPSNRIIRLMLQHDYASMFRLQVEERKNFNYPPFCRLIKINLKHRDRSQLNLFSEIFGNNLKAFFGKRVLGPEYPLISRIQLYYIKTIIIKIEKEKSLSRAREMIMEAVNTLEKEKGAGGLKIAIDVDPN